MTTNNNRSDSVNAEGNPASDWIRNTMAKLLNDFRRIVTLFAGFFIGMHIAVFLHEVGHALGFRIGGGTVARIVMEAPLPAGRVEGHGPGESAHLWVWGGVVFGSLITAVPLAIARRLTRRSIIRFALLMAAAFCLGHNGMYMFVGSMIPFSDASNMIHLGAPRWLLFVLGAPLLVGFVVILTSAIKSVGLTPSESIQKWVVIVELGLFTFPAVMVASMFFMPVRASVRTPTIAFVSCYAICFCIAACRARSVTVKFGSEIENTHMNQKWSVPCKLILIAVVLVFAEWLAFGTA